MKTDSIWFYSPFPWTMFGLENTLFTYCLNKWWMDFYPSRWEPLRHLSLIICIWDKTLAKMWKIDKRKVRLETVTKYFTNPSKKYWGSSCRGEERNIWEILMSQVHGTWWPNGCEGQGKRKTQELHLDYGLVTGCVVMQFSEIDSMWERSFY